jgi:hypothetical protein
MTNTEVSSAERATLVEMHIALYEMRVDQLGPDLANGHAAGDLSRAVAWSISAMNEAVIALMMIDTDPRKIADMMDRVKAELLSGRYALPENVPASALN